MLNIAGLRLPMIGDEIVTGNVYFVDSGAAGANNGNLGIHPENSPLATLAGAMDKVTASNGDWIILMPGHAETTTAVALDVAGVTIAGVGHGRQRPTFTATTAASDLFDVTADDIRLRNIRTVSAASGCTSFISIAANGFECERCLFEHGAAPLIAVIVTGGYDRFVFRDCLFHGTAANPDCAIDLQGTGNCVDWTVEGCTFNYYSAANLDEAGIRSDKTDTGVIVRDCRFLGMTLTAIDFNSSSTGLLEDITVVSLNATQTELMDIGLMGCKGVNVTYQGVDAIGLPVATATA